MVGPWPIKECVFRGMNREKINILRQFQHWLEFRRETGVRYLQTDEALTSLMAILLEKQVASCRACRLYSQGRVPLFGQGPMDAGLMVAGDMPLPEDISRGRAFTGEPGSMLTKMLDAIGISRNEVFVTTAVKCCSGTGDLSDRGGVDQCGKWLERQIRIIKPSFILSLGPLAADIILEMHSSSVEDFRGNIMEPAGRNFKMIVTHSPAFLLKVRGSRLNDLKKEAWHDLKLLETVYHGCV